MDEDSDIIGILDEVGDFRGVSRKDAFLQREPLKFRRLIRNVWISRLTASVFLNIVIPASLRLSIVISDLVVFEGSAKTITFPKTGIPLSLGFAEIVVESLVEPIDIIAVIQRPPPFSVAAGTIEWAGFYVNMFGQRFFIDNLKRLKPVKVSITSKPHKRRQSLLLTTSHFLKDYFWTEETPTDSSRNFLSTR